jgi:hypothetical protein
MFGLTSFMVKPLLNKMRGQLEKQFGKKIETFDIVFVASTNVLNIVINSVFYPYSGDGIKDMIMKTAKKRLKPLQSLDIITATIDKNNKVIIHMGYTEGIGESAKKLKTTYTI